MWIELHDSSRDHPKIIRLAMSLGLSHVSALGHMTSLWLWCLRMAPDGDLSSFDETDIELGAYWEGEPGAFVAECVKRKLIDKTENGYMVHDWGDYSSTLRASDRKKKERERKAEYRARKAAEEAQKKALIDPPKPPIEKTTKETLSVNVPGTSADSPECPSVVTLTGPDLTRPDLILTPSARSAPALTEPAAEPPVITIPVISGDEFQVTKAQVDEWASTFTGVDVLQQLKTARQWCLANPERKKTKRGVPKFLVGWLSREQDRGRVVPGTVAGRSAHVGYHQGSTSFGEGDQVL